MRAGIAVKQPAQLAEWAEVCEMFRKQPKPTIPVNAAYDGAPTRVYVINAAGKVAYEGGRGPFGLKPAEVVQALVMALLEASPDRQP